VNGLRRLSFSLLAIASLIALCGCEDKPLTISYHRPPEYQIPDSVERIAIARFGGKTAMDRKYGDIAADELASALDAYNKQYQRYQLVDRKRLRAILDERDMQLAIADTPSATQVGKLADVQAMIYGSVSVSTRDEQASRMGFDFSTQRPKTVYYTKRYCTVSVNFTMDDIRTGRTLSALTLTRQYDSDKNGKSKGGKVAKAMGISADELPPADQILNRLIAECVAQFIRKISPHQVTITEKMEKGKSRIVETGNKLARAGDYSEALECYLRGLKSHPDDDGAMFNAGLVHEAMGQLDKAEDYYSRAFALKDREKYVLARRRVRREVGE
jgi:tetratricopeptide (TPR) repeat protein